MDNNKYHYSVEGVNYDVVIEEIEGNIARVNVNGKSFSVLMKEPVREMHRQKVAHIEPPKPAVASSKPEAVEPVKKEAVAAGSGNKVYAPLPGTITEIKVNVGDTIKAGDTVVVLEAMKMQNNIEADYSGKITSILVKQGDTVLEGSTLLTIE